ncbi:hypothetical protein FRC03_001229 [Tulasnella sp. 419]|nr:hypothetical protein FRC03_001229 [Tulasnella sp. 419]
MDIQTDDAQPEFREVEIQTSPLPEVIPVEISTMTIQREVVDIPEELTIRITGNDDERFAIPRPRVLSVSTTRSPRPVAMIFDDPETETDGEYADARETPGLTPTPADSVSDFHSANGGSSADGSERDEESDAESVRTSRMATRDGYAALTVHRRKISEVSNGTSRPPTALAAPVPIVEIPKPEMKEASIQTDSWSPPPAILPVPPSPVFQRVGSTSSTAPPFQYISSPSKDKAPASTSSTTTTTTPTAPTSLAPVPRPSSPKGTKGILRDSVGTFGGSIPRRSQTPSGSRTDRRTSIESAFTQGEDSAPRSIPIPMPPPPPVDKTKPPTMMLPPPPSMPPPSIIPVKKPVAPPRPTSPPPPELIQRATTPTFGRSGGSSVLNVPAAGRSYIRQHGSSLPSNAQGLRQPVSTSSFRSAPHPNNKMPGDQLNSTPCGLSSATSLLSGISSAAISRRASVSSSHSSELNHPVATHGRIATSNSTSIGMPGPQDPASTDPDIIHAITQTMIGEFLYKYTRPLVGKGLGEKRHKRFFWVHPYTKTLYWSNADPGASNVGESSAKSTYIDGVKSVLDPNPLPPGVYQYSIVVSTPQREMKFTAPNKERHDIWYNALNYLLARPSTVPMGPPSTENLNSPNDLQSPAPRPGLIASPRSVRSVHSTHSYSITPRAMRSQTQLSHHGSIGKRPGTPAAEYLRWAEDPQSPRSIRSYRQEQSNNEGPEDFDPADPAEEVTFELNDNGFEGLENVRACCDGEHDLGTLNRRPSQHQHHHHHHHPVNHTHSRPTTPAERPISPSAWSFRSKSGSTHSDGGLFGWAGDAKRSIRFKRAKSPAPSKPGIPFARSNN